MIARSLCHHPRILFLDEPTAGLDPAIRRRIWSLIKKVRQDGVTIFLTTHYIEEAEFLADRVAFLHLGQVVKIGIPQDLMDSLGLWAVDQFLENEMNTNFFPGREEANSFIQTLNNGGTIRRVNLEDCFLSLTGKKVQ
jgi:ABC-2 type transport system ATP-binding protein